MLDTARNPLTKHERWCLYLILVLVLGFAGLVEMRSAFLSRRMGDFGCYARGAWAVRTGTNLYEVKEENDWHYCYPPFLAIMLVPLADPPPGQPAMLPYSISVGLWCLFNLACLVYGVHILAGALERQALDPQVAEQPRYCRRWWALRLWPVLVCLIPIGHTLMRGQVNLLVLALLCGMIAALLEGYRFRAGFLLAVAGAIKVIPFFLVLYPLWRRDGRFFAGLLLGLLVTVILLPLAAFGPRQTVTVYQSFARTVLGPALALSEDKSREEELHRLKGTDNQSLQSAMFNAAYPDHWTRPTELVPWVKWTHRVLAVLMTAWTFWAGIRAGFRTGWPLGLFLGALMYLMSVLGPMCHLHYFTFLVPLVMALMAQRWEFNTSLHLGTGLWCLCGLFSIAILLPNLPGLDTIRDLCLPLYASLGLWITALFQLWQNPASCNSLDNEVLFLNRPDSFRPAA